MEATAPGEEYGRAVTRLTTALRSAWIDAAVVAAALVAALAVVVDDDPDGPRTTALVAAPLAASVVLPLLARRRLAFGAPVAVWLMGAASSFVDGRLIVSSLTIVLAGMGAAFLLGHLPDDRQARLGLAIVLAGAAIIVYNDPDHRSGQYLFIPAQFALFWIAGYALRERSARAEAAEASARVAVAEERARIARELHDVVAHAVSVMVLQVGAVRHGLPAERGEDAEALLRVEQAGRTALTEMRGLLNAMRQEGDAAELGPQPTLADVDALVGSVRRAGLPVTLRVEGPAAQLPAGVELSAYRIIQEGLTNALKHARATRAEVLLRYGADELEIEVRDDGVAAPAANGGGGHGLVGMRERVKIYGGELSAGAGAEGGFTLRTRLPLTGQAA
jgi:signal transduction histidine kinase